MNIRSEGILPREQLTTITPALTPKYDTHVRKHLEQSLHQNSDGCFNALQAIIAL